MKYIYFVYLIFALIGCSLSEDTVTPEADVEPFLEIYGENVNSSTVLHVGEIKGLFCKSSDSPIEWFTPSNTKVENKSIDPRVYVINDETSFPVTLAIRNVSHSDAGNWTCKAGNLTQSINIIVEGTSICELPAVKGPCRALFPRYAYDSKKKDCVRFGFGGCQGNVNNFKNYEECMEFCGNFSDA